MQQRMGSTVRPSVAAGLYAGIFALFASVLWRHRGFPLDDSWIYQVIARNFAETHVLGFIPGRLTSGATSYLWTLVLTAGQALLPHVPQYFFNAAVSVLLMAGIGAVLARLTVADGIGGAGGWCLVLGPLLSGNFLWFGLLGMEHLLFLLLSLALVTAWTSRSEGRGRWDRAVLAALAFLLGMTRPEGVFLVVVLAAMRSRNARRWADWIWAAAGSACAGVLMAGLNWMISGKLTPQTMKGRQMVSATHSWKEHLSLLPLTYVRLLRTWTLFNTKDVGHRGLVAGAVLGLVVVALLGLGLRALWNQQRRGWMLLCVWAVTIELLYIVILPNPGHGGRYISLPLTVILCLLAFGVKQGFAMAGLRGRAATAALLVLGLACAVESYAVWMRAAAAGVDQINSEHGALAEWMEENLPAELFRGPHVAVYDIGRIGYQFHGNLFDMGALVDSRFSPYLAQRRVGDYLRAHGVEYIVLPSHPGQETEFTHFLGLDSAHRIELKAVRQVCADPAIAWRALYSAGTGDPCQTLYRLSYGGAAAEVGR